MATETQTRIADLAILAAEGRVTEPQFVGPLMAQYERLMELMLADGAVFVLPHGAVPGVTHIWNVPVVRADVERPMIAIPGA